MTLLAKLQALAGEECFCESHEAPCPRCCTFMELGEAHTPDLVKVLEAILVSSTIDFSFTEEELDAARTVLAELEEALDA